ncbi:MAG: helix-turn-helix transcriptional regulator [Oscillospiraceae bacterium]|nr:helix-turn-helix transcriptional regulator [Oscillospiraceae bacterium]
MTYYENLRVIREDRGYTQKQIAEILETTQQYYSDYENGKRDIPIRVYIVLSKFYNVSIDYLAGQTDVAEQISGLQEKADAR